MRIIEGSEFHLQNSRVGMRAISIYQCIILEGSGYRSSGWFSISIFEVWDEVGCSYQNIGGWQFCSALVLKTQCLQFHCLACNLNPVSLLCLCSLHRFVCEYDTHKYNTVLVICSLESIIQLRMFIFVIVFMLGTQFQ